VNLEIAESILRWEDNPDAGFFTPITDAAIEDQGRWTTQYSKVTKDTRDNSFWMIFWFRGSTEIQDNGPEDIYYNQVWPIEVTKIEYVTKNPKE